jgi:hypothetical protein
MSKNAIFAHRPRRGNPVLLGERKREKGTACFAERIESLRLQSGVLGRLFLAALREVPEELLRRSS